ncbi:hypothetical protein M0R72_08035 [Candidatus Pacearchaeota archaeon]|jgi:hypothetical protein|nr:hypothetical protein [Candidatus Pacearchaeota archaeon]
MKKIVGLIATIGLMLFVSGCDISDRPRNTTALDEQAATEINQKGLFQTQPPPRLSWSLERDNLIKRFKLQNDRSVMFYMYLFIPGVADPIGYYQVNKVSSVNSQLTNTEQIVQPFTNSGVYINIPSPAEDGSYGTNGDGVFGFTPEDIYIEHNMLYVVSTVPLSFRAAVQRLTIIDVATEAKLKSIMDKIK